MVKQTNVQDQSSSNLHGEHDTDGADLGGWGHVFVSNRGDSVIEWLCLGLLTEDILSHCWLPFWAHLFRWLNYSGLFDRSQEVVDVWWKLDIHGWDEGN